MMKKSSLVVALIGIAVGGYYFYQQNNAVRDTSSQVISKPNADAIFKARIADLAGVRQPLAQWRGKILVVNFWATWCPPCRQEIPEFIALQKQYGEQGLQFVGIALDEKAKIQNFVDEVGINYPILVGDLEAVALAQASGNRMGGLPYTVVIDQKGNVVATEMGALSREKLTTIITPLLAKKSALNNPIFMKRLDIKA
ncbi:MAG: redoxin family protein [Sulfuriferula sp.]